MKARTIRHGGWQVAGIRYAALTGRRRRLP